MDGRRLRLTTGAEVRARIAEIVLGDEPRETRIGDISLEPHQISAVARIELALEEFGGALLCDEVGMGKTFVAAAAARKFTNPLVVAPAALAEMWRQALAAAQIGAEFVSFEKLSSVSTIESTIVHDLLIVDEAHHARNRATRRYRRLRELARNSKVLLLSATPIHNHRGDLLAVLSLFLGSRSSSLTPHEIARCAIRREHADLRDVALIPTLLPVEMLEVADDAEIVPALMNLPEPVPTRDGGIAPTLIARSLAHQWASSQAALEEALRKRIARAIALTASLEAGTYPTKKELTSWIFCDDSLQLGFPELLSATFTDARQLLASIRRHRDALEALRAACSLASPRDDQRANHLVRIRRAHPDAKIVAFAQYAETLAMLFRKLAPAGRVAMLTANGARVAGGKLSRYEALARFAPDAVRAPPPGTAERIDLLLATDLLAEGVNLQDAQIVVHLDVPWTAARMEQRVGRVARMGSRHPFVHTYFIRPPRSAARLLRSESIVSRKWNVARLAVGAGRAPLATPLENDLHSSGVDASAANDSVTRLNEQLRACLERWRRPYTKSDDTIVASVLTSKRGLLAAVTLDGSPKLLTSLSGNVLLELGGQLSACILAAGLDTNSTEQEIDEAMAAIRLWSESESASVLAGASNSSAVHRRRLANRIDSVIDTAPPHLRVQWLERASRARRVVGVQQSAAIEAELGALMTSPLPPEEWLQKISKLSPRHNDESPSSNQLPTERGELRTPNPTERRELQLPNLDIHAVLLLRTKLVK